MAEARVFGFLSIAATGPTVPLSGGFTLSRIQAIIAHSKLSRGGVMAGSESEERDQGGIASGLRYWWNMRGATIRRPLCQRPNLPAKNLL
ncbi:hypothetical protein PHAMO_280130 [Magnetospirillum molischianum DSM 120]|uniref:Uncharacterized protein n=1 Tax=Magnetospirillum molischianum DSM 120 TaxID=1150626 RepID=H8FTA8_MAGML|nr:hypothetical protein PHAMO_280130 [Magnetospirillum molischianum DSM 120]